MATPSDFEQLLLEYINRARLDPQGEFDRFIVDADTGQAIESGITSAINYFNVDLDLYRQQLEGLEATAPLAWNSNLNQAATTHSQLMIAHDEQSHQLSGEAGLGTRISAAGYDHWNFLAENIFAYAQSPAYAHAGFFIDWGYGPGGMQNPAGHRVNIMRDNLTEVGIGVVAENNGSTDVGPYVVTQDFGNRWDYDAQFVGVVYDDDDNDVFYSMGEGRGGVSVTVTPASGSPGATATWSSGGYQLEGVSGANTVTFSGGGLAGSVSVDVGFHGENVKIDLVDGTRIETSVDAALGSGATGLTLLGEAEVGYGNAAANAIVGNAQDNTFLGFAGEDTLHGGAGDDLVYGNTGDDTVYGGAGSDYLHGGKHHDFVDGGDGHDMVLGGVGDDTIAGVAGNDSLWGNEDNDAIAAGDGDDYVHGGRDEDLLQGEAGNDTLRGGKGNDTLEGGDDDDLLDGAAGVDYLSGGSGNDRFYFDSISDSPSGAASRDVILGGFDNPGALSGDVIDVSGIAYFVFLGTSGFSGGGGAELRLADVSGDALVQGDVDGNGTSDFEVLIDNLTASSLSGGDFIGIA